jgi:serine/threonine protein phosphatase PrpC
VSIKPISAAASDIGKHRSSNQDSGYAGYQLFFVADGMGGHAGGDMASAISSQRIALSDNKYENFEEAQEELYESVIEANRMLNNTVAEHPELTGMGTTFSGILIHENRVIIAHIGDSRVYLSRNGGVTQITSDHTFVQKLLDTGRITEEEALTHPRRSVLMRVLGDVQSEPELDLVTLETRPGDRWLICSDGLSGVVPDELLEQILLSEMDAQETVESLVDQALKFDAPDNVTVVLTDIVDAKQTTEHEPSARFVGSSANEIVIEEQSGSRILRLLNPKNLVDLLTPSEDPTSYAPESEELLEKILRDTQRKIRWRSWRIVAGWVLIFGAAIGVGYAGYEYTQTRYYVAESDGKVAIFKGIRESLGPLNFSSEYEVTNLVVDELPAFQQTLIERSISAESLSDAERIIQELTESVRDE